MIRPQTVSEGVHSVTCVPMNPCQVLKSCTVFADILVLQKQKERFQADSTVQLSKLLARH